MGLKTAVIGIVPPNFLVCPNFLVLLTPPGLIADTDLSVIAFWLSAQAPSQL